MLQRDGIPERAMTKMDEFAKGNEPLSRPVPDWDRNAPRGRWLTRRNGLLLLGALALAAASAVWLARSSGLQHARVSQTDSASTDLAHATPVDAASAPSMLSDLVIRVQGTPVTSAARALPRADDLMQRASANPGTPEARLLRVYALMAEADGNQALEEARKLAQDVPTFSLAHLVYADLLKARTAPLVAFGGAASGAAEAGKEGSPGFDFPQVERLKDLSAEARARVGGATSMPPPGTLPSQFAFLSPLVHNAIAVDASRSRLYLFENTPNGMVLRRDYYASVGKLGTAKRIEGDLRTPLGVYFVTGRLAKAKLADRYGASAMVLNYPNQYDQLRGRTGSGIWLHGVESSYFSRAPQATDGCVALSNTDLLHLSAGVDRQTTPVLIADRLDWVTPDTAAKIPDDFALALASWRSARQLADPSTELAFYAGVPRPAPAGSAPAQHWVDVLRAERSRPLSQAVQLTQLSVLAWHDLDDVMLVTYSESNGRDAHPRLKRQYWLLRDGRWQIVFDGAVS